MSEGISRNEKSSYKLQEKRFTSSLNPREMVKKIQHELTDLKTKVLTSLHDKDVT